MADPCDAGVLLISVTHGATPLGVATRFNFEHSIERLVLRGEGKVGPSCRPIIARDVVALVDFLVKGPIVPDISASLVIVTKDSDANTITDTLTTMLSDGYAKEMDRDAPPARYRQRFVHKGGMDSDPIS